MSSEVWLLGDPISGSLSPAMQNAAFEAAGIDCRYVLERVDEPNLANKISVIRAVDAVIGANVTIPHKESVTSLLDVLDPTAARIGAVNTISRRHDRLKGWNTDVDGFRTAFSECGYDADGKFVAIIGAGGAARAVAAALQSIAAGLWVIARNLDQAKRLCADLEVESGGPVDLDRSEQVIPEVAVVVNATPADLPVISRLRSDQRLFDLRSRRSVEGRAMLLHQGAAAFEIWTGQPAPVDAMRTALERAGAVPA